MSAETTPIYLDPTQPVDERVKDLLGRMTVAEKISQMRNSASAVERLGIPAYDFWNEALHGVARNGRATVFPQAIGMAATWYPGQEGGKALADVLFGHISPSGKLPLTFPKSVEQLPPFDDYDMADRTYRYARWEPLFPFGFGLSYSTFEYSQLSLAQSSLAAGADLSFSVTVANRGTREAEEVLQVYLSDLEASVQVPQQRLVDFRRVRLGAGESRTYAFTLPAEKMMLYNENGDQQLEPGLFRLKVGGCSPSSRAQALGAPEPVTATFTVGS